MSSVNMAVLIGHLGADPEMRYMPSGDAVANFSLATTEHFKTKDGEKQEKTEWHRCVAFGKRADVIGEHVKKGQQIYVMGKIQTRKWDKDGQTHYSTEIHVENFQFLGKKNESSEEGAAPGKPATAKKDYETASGGGQRTRTAAKTAKAGASGFDDLESDIPF